MVGHCRAPGVQHRRDADAGSEVLGVGRDPEHRLRRGLEQQIVDHGLVLVGDVANRRRQSEDDVDVGNREQFGLADRKSTRLNSSHQIISYAVFCLKKKKNSAVTMATTATGGQWTVIDKTAKNVEMIVTDGNTMTVISTASDAHRASTRSTATVPW